MYFTHTYFANSTSDNIIDTLKVTTIAKKIHIKHEKQWAWRKKKNNDSRVSIVFILLDRMIRGRPNTVQKVIFKCWIRKSNVAYVCDLHAIGHILSAEYWARRKLENIMRIRLQYQTVRVSTYTRWATLSIFKTSYSYLINIYIIYKEFRDANSYIAFPV